jgi:hypothetical protein
VGDGSNGSVQQGTLQQMLVALFSDSKFQKFATPLVGTEFFDMVRAAPKEYAGARHCVQVRRGGGAVPGVEAVRAVAARAQ